MSEPPAADRARLRFGRAHRLARGPEIERVRRSGRSWSVGPLVLTAAPGSQAAAPTRAAFITGKKIGHAVERNRAKRWLREAFRLQLPYIKAGWDIILIARPSIGGSDFRRVEAALAESLKRARLYEDHRPLGHPTVSKDD